MEGGFAAPQKGMQLEVFNEPAKNRVVVQTINLQKYPSSQ